MDKSVLETKEVIIQTVIAMLMEDHNTDHVTVRKIADRIGIGVGLINYHFKSKDNLLRVAIGRIMADMATGFIASEDSFLSPPLDTLKKMLKELYRLAGKYEKLLQYTLSQGLLHGDLDTALYLVPVLKEIFHNQRDEMQLRILALQIILPLQVTAVCPSGFLIYSGIDLYDEHARDRFIDALVNNLITV